MCPGCRPPATAWARRSSRNATPAGMAASGVKTASAYFAARPQYQQLQTAMATWHDYNLAIGTDEYHKAEANYGSARLFVIVVIVFAVAIAIAIAFLLARGITRGVKNVLETATAIADEGDLSRSIDVRILKHSMSSCGPEIVRFEGPGSL